jgi:hypothetical protein
MYYTSFENPTYRDDFLTRPIHILEVPIFMDVLYSILERGLSIFGKSPHTGVNIDVIAWSRRNVDCGGKDDTESEEEMVKADSIADSHNAIDHDGKVIGKRGSRTILKRATPFVSEHLQ